jgi:regulatory protein
MAWAFVDTSDTAVATRSRTEPSLKVRAMRLLARREHTRAELRRKLAARAQEGEDVEALLDELTQRGWLSDERFAEQAARAKARRFGPLKLAHYLRSKGLGDDAIASGLRVAGADGVSSVEAVWRSRFKQPPRDEREKLRQVRFLQGRGFAVDEIFRFLNSMGSNR